MEGKRWDGVVLPSPVPPHRQEASPAVILVPIISQQGIWDHPILSQLRASHNGEGLHGAISKGTVMSIYGVAQGHV